MKVICRTKTSEDLPQSYIEPGSDLVVGVELPLTVDREYVVYALGAREGQIVYYISDDDELHYPVHWPAPLFNVADTRLSKYWKYAFTPKHLDHFALFSFEEWISDPYFYDRLTDGNEREVRIFQRMKLMMEQE